MGTGDKELKSILNMATQAMNQRIEI